MSILDPRPSTVRGQYKKARTELGDPGCLGWALALVVFAWFGAVELVTRIFGGGVDDAQG